MAAGPGSARLLVGSVAVAADLWIAAHQNEWWLAGVGPQSSLGWYGLRAALAAAALAALLLLRRSRPCDHGLAGAVPAGALRAVLRMAAWVVVAYLALLALGVVAVRAGWFHPTALPHDISTREDVLPTLALALFAAPLVEETVYRGLAVPALLACVGRRTALLLSGLLFWGLHVAYGYPLWLVHYAVAGALLAWAFLRTGRLWAAVLLHALGNLLMLADDLARLYAPGLVRALLGPAAPGLD